MKYTETRPKHIRVDLSDKEITMLDEIFKTSYSYRKTFMADPDEYWITPKMYDELRRIAQPSTFGADWSFGTLFGVKLKVDRDLQEGIKAIKFDNLSGHIGRIYSWDASDLLAAKEYSLVNFS